MKWEISVFTLSGMARNETDEVTVMICITVTMDPRSSMSETDTEIVFVLLLLLQVLWPPMDSTRGDRRLLHVHEPTEFETTAAGGGLLVAPTADDTPMDHSAY